MLMTNKKFCALLCMSAIAASVVSPIAAHADPYHNLVEYYGTVRDNLLYDRNNDTSNFGKAEDSNGITWHYEKNYDNTVSIMGTKDKRENITVPKELAGYKVRALNQLYQSGTPTGGWAPEIKSVKIPEGIERIGNSAFHNCENIEKIEIPKSATDICYNSFANTKWIKNQKYDENNCLIINKILIDAKCTKEEFVVPDNVLAVGEYFKVNSIDNGNADNLKEVVIPDNVIEVRQNAFSYCNNLEKVTFENDKTYVESYAFSNCPKLSKGEFPVRNKITTYAFSGSPVFDDITSNMTLEDNISTLPEESPLHDQKELEAIMTKDANKLIEYGKNKNKVDSSNGGNTSNNTSSTSNNTSNNASANNNANSSNGSQNKNVKAGWNRIGDYWYYYDSNKNMKTGFQTINNKNYYFYSTGEMAVGLVNLGNSSYIYADPAKNSNEGVLFTGWKKIKSDWYYFNPQSEGRDPVGVNKTGWLYNNGCWYYFYSTGQMATGFINLGDNAFYYLDETGTSSIGIMKTGWQKINGSWYYFNKSTDGLVEGMMRFGWNYINGQWYYFYSDGKMAASTYVGGYYVNGSGAWVR